MQKQTPDLLSIKQHPDLQNTQLPTNHKLADRTSGRSSCSWQLRTCPRLPGNRYSRHLIAAPR